MTETHRNSESESALLTFEPMCSFIGLPMTRATRIFAWRGARTGLFPAPVKVGAHRVAWRRSEVAAWLESRPRAAYAQDIKAGGR